MVVAECKRFVSQTLKTLLSEKDTDASILLSILDVIKGWLEDDFSRQGSSSSSAFLHPKELGAIHTYWSHYGGLAW
ncbi:Phosphatidylinositol 3- and 4-kinase family protein with FAT domain [Euphorbia peplus]|nr:Phosphatidylinositol 3- and 4-kinase family protein with FAT domain [Euphorbia peplus]